MYNVLGRGTAPSLGVILNASTAVTGAHRFPRFHRFGRSRWSGGSWPALAGPDGFSLWFRPWFSTVVSTAGFHHGFSPWVVTVVFHHGFPLGFHAISTVFQCFPQFLTATTICSWLTYRFFISGRLAEASGALRGHFGQK